MDPEPDPEQTPDRKCTSVGCRHRIERPRIFCPRHWKALSRPQRIDLVNAYGTRDWRSAITAARKIIAEKDPISFGLLP